MLRHYVIGICCTAAILSPAFGQHETQQLSYVEFDELVETMVDLQLDSRVFRVELAFDIADPDHQQLLEVNGGAYVNVLFRPDPVFPWEWAVQNVHESLPDLTWFELGNVAYEFGSEIWPNGLDLEFCELYVELTPEPAKDKPVSPPDINLKQVVLSRDRTLSNGSPLIPLESEDPVELEPYIPWESMQHRIGQGAKGIGGARTGLSPKGIGDVEEGTNQCSPGATSRSALYLSKFWGFPLEKRPNPDEPPVASGVQDLLDALHAIKKLSGPEPDFNTQPALFWIWFAQMNLFHQYRQLVYDDWGLPIRSRDEQMWFPLRPSAATFGAVENNARNNLQHGHDVELSLEWLRAGVPVSAHLAMLVKMQPIGDGSVFWRYTMVDDQAQNDWTPSTNVTEFLVDRTGGMWRFNGFVPVRFARIRMFKYDQFVLRLLDVNDNGIVDGADLSALLGAWGSSPNGSEDDCDFNNDGEVDGADLSMLLAGWGFTFDR